MVFQINDRKIESEFERLATQILLESVLNVNDAKFNFTEIEFYYYSEIHQDAFTHVHNEPAGKWRFHNQGIDITLKGDKGFGGILIRGVEYISSSESIFINGPRRVVYSTMEHLNKVDSLNNSFGITEKEKENSTIFKTFRQGLHRPNSKLDCDKPDYFKSANYRFIVKPQFFNRKQFSDSEKIARAFKNKELSKEFLGYNLKQ